MKLDTRAMRHLASEDWRVLTAYVQPSPASLCNPNGLDQVEMGSKNHEIVPTPLIERISRLRGGASGVHKSISALARWASLLESKKQSTTAIA